MSGTCVHFNLTCVSLQKSEETPARVSAASAHLHLPLLDTVCALVRDVRESTETSASIPSDIPFPRTCGLTAQYGEIHSMKFFCRYIPVPSETARNNWKTSLLRGVSSSHGSCYSQVALAKSVLPEITGSLYVALHVCILHDNKFGGLRVKRYTGDASSGNASVIRNAPFVQNCAEKYQMRDNICIDSAIMT